MYNNPKFSIKRKFVFIDTRYNIFFENVLDIYKNDEFFYRVPTKYKDVMIKILTSQINSDIEMEARNGA